MVVPMAKRPNAARTFPWEGEGGEGRPEAKRTRARFLLLAKRASGVTLTVLEYMVKKEKLCELFQPRYWVQNNRDKGVCEETEDNWAKGNNKWINLID